MKHEEIIYHMIENDEFSKWLGINLISSSEESVVLQMEVTKQMTNGHKIAHGGITYSLADSTLAFTVNFHGIQAVSADTSISHLRAVYLGDTLKSISKLKKIGRQLAWVDVDVFNQNNELVAQFRGSAFRSGKSW